MSLSQSDLRQLQIMCGGLIAGPVLFLGVGLLLRAIGAEIGDVPIVTYVACAAAVLAPLVAGLVRRSLREGFAGESMTAVQVRRSTIVSMGILEGATLLCAMAFVVSATYVPLVAALLPLGTMVLWFPRK